MRYNEEIIQEWIQLYTVEAWTAAQIAVKYKCSSSNVLYHLRKTGTQMRRSGMRSRHSKKTIQEWIRLYTIETHSTCRIAKKYKCSQTIITDHLRKHGVKIRSQKVAVSLPWPRRKKSRTLKGKYVGPKSPRYGKQHTKESLQKMSEIKKGKMVGPENPNWRGGTSFLPYASSWTKELKLKIKTRDNFACQHPNGDCKGYLIIHHIDYNKMNCGENNLIVLCGGHNGKVNSAREYWTKYFQLLVTANENSLITETVT